MKLAPSFLVLVSLCAAAGCPLGPVAGPGPDHDGGATAAGDDAGDEPSTDANEHSEDDGHDAGGAPGGDAGDEGEPPDAGALDAGSPAPGAPDGGTLDGGAADGGASAPVDAGSDEPPPDDEPEGPPLLEPASAAESGVHTVTTFFNVLRQSGADPWVYKHDDGFYYYTQTTGGNVTLWRSRTLTGLGHAQRKVIWTKPASGAASRAIWAPELHFLRGKWYVYVAADDESNVRHRMYVLENPDADPFSDNWTFKGKISDASDRWAIDGTVLEVQGELYFIWSGWPGTTNGKQNLYIAHMSDPLTIDSPRVLLSTPTYAWETNTNPMINEGPQVIVKNGVISLVYSASGSWTNSYCLGLITASVGSDLLDPDSWTKRSTPLFQSANGLYGPGHHSFTRSPDESEDWIVYHTARWSGSGWTRLVRAQPFQWKANHTPDLGEPAPPNVPLPLPSGEPARMRYEAEDAAMGGGAHAVNEASASGGKKVGYIDAPDAHLTFTVWVPKAGRYALSFRAGNGTAGEATSTYRLSVNGGPPSDVSTVYSGWNRWVVVSLRRDLEAGHNTLRLSRGSGYMELDLVEVSPLAPLPGGPVADGTYRILAGHSGKALDVGGCSTSDGANVIQWPYWGGGCQQWRLEHLGDGVYNLLALNSGKALEVVGGSSASGANVGVMNRWGGYHQQWFIEPLDDGSHRLRARHSGQVLQVAGCSTADAANVRQQPDEGLPCQRWRIEPR